MFPEGTHIAISLVIPFVVNTFEAVWTWLITLYFKSWRISLEVYFATPYKMSIVFYLMRAITFDAFESMYMAHEHCIAPLPAVLILGYSWIHVSIFNCSNMASYIEASVNQTFGIDTALDILYVDPNYSHI